uniref:Uncharacterized protein n=1 Tax=Lepeophtheirus salmonis TaxID=72036 RepID=A0A0K2T2T8_LEPSM
MAAKLLSSIIFFKLSGLTCHFSISFFLVYNWQFIFYTTLCIYIFFYTLYS